MDRREFIVAAAALVAVPHGALGDSPVALVTADLESRLVAVDAAHGRVLRHVRTLAFPRSIETVGEVAVVAHSEIGAVSIVDARAVRHVLRGFGEPRYTAAHPDGRHAFVTDAARGEVVTLDVARGLVLGRTTVGMRARHVTIDRAGRTLRVALGSKAEEIAVVDVSVPARPRLVRRFVPPFLAHDVGIAPDGRLWVTSGDGFELAVYDRRGRVVARPWAHFPPQHVTFGPDRAYVTSGWSGTLRVHRLDGRPLGLTQVPVGSYNVQERAGLVVTPSLGHGDVAILDRNGRLRHRLTVARSAHDACLL